MVNVPYLGDPSAGGRFFLRRPKRLAFCAGPTILSFRGQQPVGRRARPDHARAGACGQRGADATDSGSAHIHAYFHSYATPDDPYATDRKPSPELLLAAAEANDLDLSQSFFIGDRLSDIECGINAGCRTIFIEHEKSSRRDVTRSSRIVTAKKKADYIHNDRWLTRRAGSSWTYRCPRKNERG